MSMSDPLADMLTRIRNAVLANHNTVEIPYSKIKEQIANILKNEGYIVGFIKLQNDSVKHLLRVTLNDCSRKENVIRGIRRISKPGRRVYCKWNEIPKVLSGLGISILSTSGGLLTDQEARIKNVGGEILCEVW